MIGIARINKIKLIAQTCRHCVSLTLNVRLSLIFLSYRIIYKHSFPGFEKLELNLDQNEKCLGSGFEPGSYAFMRRCSKH